MKILVAGATGSIGIHVVNTAIAMGHQPVALVRNRRKIKLLPRGTDIFYGDVSIPETLTDLPKDIDAIIFTLGSDGQGRIGARAIDYGGVRNILRIFMDTPVRIALMTTIGVTERLSSWNQRTEVHDWKRRSERLVRACGHIYTIVRPGWFDYNNDDEHRIVMLQGDRRHAGTPEDSVISREQIAQVLVTALSNDAASAAGRPSLLDDEFIQTHTVGFDELRRDVLNSEWKDIERISGLSQTQIAELADAYAAAERTIICYGMGITQHEHGTQNVQQLVNLLLMKGNIGKPGAGICPLRGHSNVQGDRTVGITEKPSAEFLDRLGERYGFTPPHAPGHAAIASMQAICTGQARALICMGGNFALAMPDREASAVPLTQLDLAVHVATKLNRSHLLTARHSYILPVLGRSEIDMQKSGAQAVTVEDSMSMIHASRGVLKPAGVMLKSECAVVAGIAQAALPQSVVAWEYLVEDYDRIRNDIEAVLPEFADYNQRIRHPGGFHLINAAAERRWMTSSGKANFITSKGLLEDPSSAFNSKLVMATVRSHDQYNTTIYGMDDRYRGVFGQRDVVFMSAKQAKICRVKNGERVNLIALTPDGKRSSRRMDRLKVVIYPMADRSLVTYFPESNHMLTLDNHDPLSGIPGYKSIPVELEPSN